MFDRLIWQENKMLLDNLVFRLEHYKTGAQETDSECFFFYKIKELVDQYEQFLASRRDFRPANIFELGIWDGGSVAFWFECFQPQKHAAIDLSQRGNSLYFRNYVESRGLTESVKTFWGVDQADVQKIRGLVEKEFAGTLDLVVDDASHQYGPTRGSFETLFPLLRPGGWYIIEGWAWEHWGEFHAVDHPWAAEPSLTKLIFELVEATGTSTALIASLAVYEGFVAIERGVVKHEELCDFNLNNHIARRPGQRLAKAGAQTAAQETTLETLRAEAKEWERLCRDAERKLAEITASRGWALLQRL